MTVPYTALIRTHNSFPVVEQVIAALRAQTAPPAHILVVDSHSAVEQVHALAVLADEVVAYPDVEFNYSKAINIGVERCSTPWVLIISSHVVLEDRGVVERAMGELQSSGASAFYFHYHPQSPWLVQLVGRANFDGHNGLHNTCSFLPVSAVMDRPFREDVFSAEDQEWAANLFRRTDATILRVGIDTLSYLNPFMNEEKMINEEVSIAYFTCRERMGIRYLAVWLFRAALYFAAGRIQRSRSYMTIFKELVLARFRPPARVSRYF